MAQITTVIFDWGGVLIDNPSPGIISYCSQALGADTEQFQLSQEDHLPAFQTGAIEEHEFWQRITTDLGVALPRATSLWSEAFQSTYSPRPLVFSWIENLRRKNYKTAVLSNTEPPSVKIFQQYHPNKFDQEIFSCFTGSRKPERKIYKLALTQIDSMPAETIFLDDREDFVQAAASVGINAHRTVSIEDVRIALDLYSIPTT